MLAVISPAKNLDWETPAPQIKASQPALLNQAERLVNQLRSMAPHELSALMRISDKLGHLNYQRYQQWQRPFNKNNARPAIFTFAGDVYQGLDAHSFTADDLAFAQDHLRILSGLYGLLRPLDLMQAYRLEMGTALANPHGKDLYAFWGDQITDALNSQLKKLSSTTLINLASNEYFKAVKPRQLKANLIEPVFKDWKNGQYKVISFYAKKARGLMSAYIVKEQLTRADELRRFDWGGYQFNETMSDDRKWVFTRRE